MPLYISSYEITDPRFRCVWERPKRNKGAAGGGGKMVMERMYTRV